MTDAKLRRERITNDFYAMMSLANVVRLFADRVVAEPECGGEIKQDMNRLIRCINALNGQCRILANKGKGDSDKWISEFTERDIEVYSSVFYMLNDCDESQRQTIEQMIEDIKNGTLVAVAAETE